MRHPWAWLIANGWKPVENRSGRTNIPFPVLIHAAKVCDDDNRRVGGYLAQQQGIEVPDRSALDYGGIVGVAEIVDCLQSHPSPFFTGPFGYVLENARPLPFIACRGMLGFLAPKLS